MKNNEKVRLTESELKQVVLESVKKILVKEGLGQWMSDKFDDAFRGYKVREGQPQNILDVIKSNGWTYNEDKPFDPSTSSIKVRKATGAFGGHHGLSIEELIEDLNIFLKGKGRASFKGKTKPYEYEIVIHAPFNALKSMGLNESIYGNDGFESTMSNDSDLPVQENKNMEETVGRAILYLGDDVEDGVIVSAGKFGLRNKSLKGQKIINLFVDDAGLITGRGKYGQLVFIETTDDSFRFSELTRETQEALCNIAKRIISKKGGYVNESAYGDNGFESTSTMEVKQMTPEEINELFWMIEDKGDHDEDGHHIFLSPGIIYNGDEMDTIFSSDLMYGNKVSVHGKKSSYEFDELPYNIQQQIFQDVNEYEPEEYEEEYDDDDDWD